MQKGASPRLSQWESRGLGFGGGRGIEEGAGRRAAGPAAAVRWERSRRAAGPAAQPPPRRLAPGGPARRAGRPAARCRYPAGGCRGSGGRRAEGALQGPGGEAEAGGRHPAGTGRRRHGRGYLTVRPPQAGAGCGRPAGQPARRAGLGAAAGRPHGGEAAGPAGLCPPDLAGCSKRRCFCTGTCTKICGGGSNPLHFGSRYDKINVESCSAAYFFLHTKKPEGGRPPCEALL